MTVRVVLNLREIAECGLIIFNTYTNFFSCIVAFHYPYIFQNINYLDVTSLNFKILNMFQLQFFFFFVLNHELYPYNVYLKTYF